MDWEQQLLENGTRVANGRRVEENQLENLVLHANKVCYLYYCFIHSFFFYSLSIYHLIKLP